MLNEVILSISENFVGEANSSPKLIEDMAAMEKYLAESYGERIFIELLQNADDAQSTKVEMLTHEGHLFFANDGRPFNNDDILAISRSGASQKRRGQTIGYRGVGFKSASYLSKEIIIFSNNTFFTFSKDKCANVLGMDSSRVPTIRIPFLIEKSEIEIEIQNTVQTLVDKGFKTIFVFVNARFENLKEELQEINNGYFLFLNHLLNAKINTLEINKSFIIDREDKGNYSTVNIYGEGKQTWWLFHHSIRKKITLAILLDSNGKMIPCDEKEAVFHCYLPTVEKTGFPFKINSDFSTDPSRKHLTMDDETQSAIKESARAIFYLITSLLTEKGPKQNPEFLELLNHRISFSKFSLLLNEKVKGHIVGKEWLPLSSGTLINPRDYIKEPNWLEHSEFNALAQHSSYIQERRLKRIYFEQNSILDKFLSTYSLREFELEDLIEILKDKQLVIGVNQRLYGKLLGQVIKRSKIKSLIRKDSADLSSCFLPVNEQIVVFDDVANMTTFNITSDLMEGISEIITIDEVRWFDERYSTAFSSFIESNQRPSNTELNSRVSKITKGITRWRAAEQQCVELEESWGNVAKDVSKQNLGYDVTSQTPRGTTRYIEVKMLGKGSSFFTLTNNEYSAAHQLGEDYFLCLISQDENRFVATYVQNPINTLELEKRVRQWEWICENYSGEQYIVEYV